MSEMTLWGFDGSTYVRCIKMLLAEKNFSNCPGCLYGFSLRAVPRSGHLGLR